MFKTVSCMFMSIELYNVEVLNMAGPCQIHFNALFTSDETVLDIGLNFWFQRKHFSSCKSHRKSNSAKSHFQRFGDRTTLTS